MHQYVRVARVVLKFHLARKPAPIFADKILSFAAMKFRLRAE
jgi:hypothetical protein